MALATSMYRTSQTRYGVVLGITPSTDSSLAPLVEVWHTTNGSATSTQTTLWTQTVTPVASTASYFQYTVVLPNSTKTWRFTGRHAAYRGVSAGQFAAIVQARPADLSDYIEGGRLNTETYRRTNTLYETDAVLQPSVTNNDGTLNLAPVKGYLTGTANGGRVPSTSWTDGTAVTFPQTYDAAPQVRLFPGSGVVYLERRATVWSSSGTYNSTAPQYIDLTPVNVTAAGFTPRARLTQRSTSQTARTDNFGTSNALTAVGQATSATIANAPAVTDTYTVHYKWRMTYAEVPPESATLVVAADANSTGAFIERATHTVIGTITAPSTATSGAHESFAVSVTGLSSTEEIRLRVKSFTPTGSTADWTVSVHGFDSLGGDPTGGVTYFSGSTSQNYAAMCATTNDVVTWVAQSVVTG